MNRFYSLIGLVLMIVLISDCKKEEQLNPSTDFINYQASNGLIGAGGGKISVTDEKSPVYGVSIDIPKNALTSPVNIEVSKVSTGYSFGIDSSKLFVSFEPSGTVFSSPVKIEIPYSGTYNDSLEVFCYDEINHLWKPIMTTNIDRVRKVVTAETNHFSTYTVSNSLVSFDLDLFKSSDKVSAKVWLITSLLELPTSGISLWNSGIHNVRDLISSKPTQVHAYYKIYLKEKNQYWFDREIDSKVVVFGVSNVYNFTSYTVQAKSSDGKVLLQSDGGLLVPDVERYFSGKPLVIYFPNAILDNSKQYYLEAKLYFIDSWGGIDNSNGFWGTKGYFVSSYKGAKSPSQMGAPPDGDGDGIVDAYDPVFGTPPLAPSIISPADNALGISTLTTLSWSCSDPDNDPLSYDLYWGTTSNPTLASSGLTSTTISKSGLANDTYYYWKIIAKDNHNNSTSSPVWKFKTILAPPVSNFSGTPTTITTGGSVQFTDQSTNSPTSWSWTFGDGSTSTSQNPSHTYTIAGTYTVSLTSGNSSGSDTKSIPNYITVNPAGSKPTANFAASLTSTTVGESVTFTDQSTNTPTSWSWNFGDGAISTSQSPSHTYSTAGTYTVALTATNSFGSDTKTMTNYVTVNAAGSKPTANFLANQTSIAVGGSVSFTDQSANNPTSWSWNFGDGTTSTSQNPSHIYSTAGVYSVTLTATNTYGSDLKTFTNYINVSLVSSVPIVNFSANKNTINIGSSVIFSDQSTTSPTSWSWNFGDGTTSTSQNPIHNYKTAGTYTVTLTATNSFGSGTKTILNYIVVSELPTTTLTIIKEFSSFGYRISNWFFDGTNIWANEYGNYFPKFFNLDFVLQGGINQYAGSEGFAIRNDTLWACSYTNLYKYKVVGNSLQLIYSKYFPSAQYSALSMDMGHNFLYCYNNITKNIEKFNLDLQLVQIISTPFTGSSLSGMTFNGNHFFSVGWAGYDYSAYEWTIENDAFQMLRKFTLKTSQNEAVLYIDGYLFVSSMNAPVRLTKYQIPN